MISSIVAGVIGLIGITSTILAWNLNPKRKIYEELDSIFKQLDPLYRRRDEALVANDSDTVTVICSAIVRLCDRKAVLLQRLK